MNEACPPFALDQYAAITCPVKTQNTFNPLAEAPGPIDADLVERFRETSSHRATVTQFLLDRHPRLVKDLRDLPPAEDRIEACVTAMSESWPIIMGADLPIDWDKHRCGTADLLFWDNQPGHPAYYPVIIKDHSVLALNAKGEGGTKIAWLRRPAKVHESRYRFRVEAHSDDLLQLAHLWYLLKAAGFAGPVAWGAVIGTDMSGKPHGCAVTWINLTEKLIRTFSYTSSHAWHRYTPIARYQHEHRFRVRVAERALQQTGSPDDPELVASPVRIAECESCEWWPQCRSSLSDDISLLIERSPLDAREIMSLRNLGISTIGDLAMSDIDALLPAYLPKVAHRAGAETRLRLASHRGRLLSEGVMLERLGEDPIQLPAADVEIDMDLENSADNHSYLWGFLVHDRRSAEPPVYHPLHRFLAMTPARELELAMEVATWLRTYIAGLDGASVLVWHYSAYEVAALRRFARSARAPSDLDWLEEFAADHFVDLLPVVREHFFGVEGLGLKAVATAGPGFTWRDPDPSGLNSQFWFADAIHGPSSHAREAAKVRVLQYNEDDVRATWTLRQWLRSLA
ncbi:MAG: TM0106 family RecB-like putative nuclease [Propionibacteriaceae bacterium]|jgi:predicted RecB family nuclease|nr:TM0106 family RecB-like putative nuclease [Propionibacteriaceae bacterium]